MFPLNTVEIANGRKFLGLAPPQKYMRPDILEQEKEAEHTHSDIILPLSWPFGW